MFIFERIYLAITLLQDRRDRDEKGAAMVEYALLVALIAIIVMAALGPLGEAIAAAFEDITAQL